MDIDYVSERMNLIDHVFNWQSPRYLQQDKGVSDNTTIR